MSFITTIQPHETRNVYRVESERGFQIQTAVPLSKEVPIIQKILAAYVEYAFAVDAMSRSIQKLDEEVSWLPIEQQKDTIEFVGHQYAAKRVEEARANLGAIQSRYNITSIAAF